MWSTFVITCHFWSSWAACVPSAIDQHYSCSQLSTPNRTWWSFYPPRCSAAGWWSCIAWEPWSYSSLEPIAGLENIILFRLPTSSHESILWTAREQQSCTFGTAQWCARTEMQDKGGNGIFVGLVKSFRYSGLIIVKYQMQVGSHLNSLSQMV